MFDLTNKIALVTGASSGIGKGIATSLAKQGAKVAIAARRIERLNELAVQLGAEKHEVMPLKMDVTKKDEITEGVAKVVGQWGRLDILVNNAGALDYSPFLEMSEEKWDMILDTNLKGYFLVAQTAAKEMVKNNPRAGGGRIINIASIASGGVGVGFPQLAHYTASKAGVIGLTEAMAIELGPHNILVNAIAPGAIESEMTKGIDISQFFGRLAVKRIGKPEEIAAAVVYLASDESSYTTGSTMYIDGGWLAS